MLMIITKLKKKIAADYFNCNLGKKEINFINTISNHEEYQHPNTERRESFETCRKVKILLVSQVSIHLASSRIRQS